MFAPYVRGLFPVWPCGPGIGPNKREVSPGSATGDCRQLRFSSIFKQNSLIRASYHATKALTFFK